MRTTPTGSELRKPVVFLFPGFLEPADFILSQHVMSSGVGHKIHLCLRLASINDPGFGGNANGSRFTQVASEIDSFEPAISAVVFRGKRLPSVHDSIVVHENKIAALQD